MSQISIFLVLILTSCCSCKYCDSLDGIEKNPITSKDRFYLSYYDQNKKY